MPGVERFGRFPGGSATLAACTQPQRSKEVQFLWVQNPAPDISGNRKPATQGRSFADGLSLGLG